MTCAKVAESGDQTSIPEPLDLFCTHLSCSNDDLSEQLVLPFSLDLVMDTADIFEQYSVYKPSLLSFCGK